MQENQFLLFLNHLRLPYSIPKSFALLLNIHIARYTFATTITLANDVKLENVSKMLGHTSTRMTQHYAHVMNDSLAREMDRIAPLVDCVPHWRKTMSLHSPTATPKTSQRSTADDNRFTHCFTNENSHGFSFFCFGLNALFFLKIYDYSIIFHIFMTNYCE